MANSIPAALAKHGIASVSDNLPPGAELAVSRDFVRIFRGEIEARLFGWSNPMSARPVTTAPLSSRTSP